MPSIHHLLAQLSPDSNTKGKQFEKITQWFLQNEPEWQAKIEKVWLWADYPDKWGVDRGIDLICQFKDGALWAVQAKCYHADYALKKADIDSFLSESNRQQIAGRILIATTNQLGSGAAQVIKAQEKPTVCILLSHLEQASVEFPADLATLNPVPQRAKPTPRPHQTEAINHVVQSLATADKGQLIMCCGTGKTYTALWIKEALNAHTTLVLLPSLGLLSQTLKEWCFAKHTEFNFLCVCSDATVSKQDDEAIAHTLELGLPVTTDENAIAQFLQSAGNKVIFSTYQSSPQIANAQQNPNIPAFDIVFADEAHRCAGNASNDFACVLDDRKIRARKKLLLTATPRIFSTAVKKTAEDRGVDIACMDDEQLFGQVLHRLNFSEAIARDLLTDYKVIIVGVDDPMIKAWIDQRELLKTDTNITADAQTFAAYVGLMKVMRDYDLKRVISFHGRVQRAQDFASQYLKVLNWATPEHKPAGVIKADYVSGDMNTSKRNDKINQLKILHQAERRLLANARCLSEGVDVPALDGVAFIDPRKSQVDIVQAVGRAIRKSDNKTHGIIIIPVFIGDSDNPEAELENSRYKPIWDVLNALRSHDDALAEELDNFRTALGRNKGGFNGGFSKFEIDLPRTVDDKFVTALNARIVEITTVSWHFWYGLLLDYIEEFGHANVHGKLKYQNLNLGAWVGSQRRKKYKLDLAKIQQLELLTQWSWNVLEDEWNERFECLKKYIEDNGHSRVPLRFKYENFSLGSWVSTQRHKKDKLDFKQIQQLELLTQWSWNVLEDEWNERFECLKQYVEENGHARVPLRFKYEDFNLGNWVSRQRKEKNTLTPDRIQLLEALPQWSWDALEDRWNERFEYLKQYAEEHGHTKVPNRLKYEDFNLKDWVSHQRSGKSKLSQERIKLLEELPQWSWNVLEDTWNDGFEYLKQYVEENGHARVPLKFKYENFNLGNWIIRQRCRKNKISLKRIKLLESLPQWSWNVLEDTWNDGFEYLKKYVEEYGHARVPNEFKYNSFNLGTWVSSQKLKKDKLDLEKIKLLEELPQWSWNVLEDQWNYGFEYLKQYVKENNNSKVPSRFKYGDFNLGQWVSDQRKRKQQNKIDLERIKKIESLSQWSWDIIDDQWNEGFGYLKKYIEEFCDAKVPAKFKYNGFNLGNWITSQRSGKNKISLERIKSLESLPQWSWSILDDKWNEGFEYLKKYIEEYGDAKVSEKFKYQNFNLGKWVSHQKTNKNKGTLNLERIQKLESLPSWNWRVKSE